MSQTLALFVPLFKWGRGEYEHLCVGAPGGKNPTQSPQPETAVRYQTWVLGKQLQPSASTLSL